MYRTIKNIIIVLVLLSAVGCNERMDYRENAIYGKEEVFGSFTKTTQFVSAIYGQMGNGFGWSGAATLASACDEAEYAWSTSNIHDFYSGAWGSTNSLSSVWGNSYSAIRSANLFLELSDPSLFEKFRLNSDYNEQMVRYSYYKYEVRFLRAYFYFNLVKHYGDAPLVTKTLTVDEANVLERTPASEIFDFIINECDELIDKLPATNAAWGPLPYNETGRISNLAVLALKARASLYAASPLFNKSNSTELWKAAALANKVVVDQAVKSGVTLGQFSALMGENSFKTPEIILGRRIGAGNSFERNNFPMGVEGGNSGNCPTQTLVDAFEYKGVIDQANPYANRDPRFDLTIAYNGLASWPSFNAKPLECFEGGLNALPLTGATPSGYYLRKFCDPSIDLQAGKVTSKRHTWIIFRLAEFYLNYAECLFNVAGSADIVPEGHTMSALTALNVVRDRIGVKMPLHMEGLGNAEFVAKYTRERMVELAFENHRFYDVRRWKTGKVLESVKLLKLTKDSESGVYTYTYFNKARRWEDKMYLFPLPESEIKKNPKLKQNPGW